jgi:hypothetical protein
VPSAPPPTAENPVPSSASGEELAAPSSATEHNAEVA